MGSYIRRKGDCYSSKANPHQKSTSLLGLVPAYGSHHHMERAKKREDKRSSRTYDIDACLNIGKSNGASMWMLIYFMIVDLEEESSRKAASLGKKSALQAETANSVPMQSHQTTSTTSKI